MPSHGNVDRLNYAIGSTFFCLFCHLPLWRENGRRRQHNIILFFTSEADSVWENPKHGLTAGGDRSMEGSIKI